jgi:hypothetical protein
MRLQLKRRARDQAAVLGAPRAIWLGDAAPFTLLGGVASRQASAAKPSPNLCAGRREMVGTGLAAARLCRRAGAWPGVAGSTPPPPAVTAGAGSSWRKVSSRRSWSGAVCLFAHLLSSQLTQRSYRRR